MTYIGADPASTTQATTAFQGANDQRLTRLWSRRHDLMPRHGAGEVEAVEMEPLVQASGEFDQGVRIFTRVQPRLFGIAYRILRSPFEAEDVVQEAWLRWQGTDRASIVNAEAFLATTTTRLALNEAQTARRRRETPAGPSLPEAPEPGIGPESGAQRSEAVELAVLLLLAKLTPAERAAYVLREAFDYPYEQIADLLRLGAANCRQLVRRARQRVASERRRPVSVVAHRRLLEAFRAAAQDGNIADLERILAIDAASARARAVGSSDYDPAAA